VATNTRHAALTALGDPTRRAIFERVAAGPKAVVEIARGLPVTRPAVSQHLKVLKDAGLVTDRKVGNRRVYQLDPGGVAALRDYFEEHWNQALAAFREAVENEEDET
jgi:DNA-binding transcriptional ArsR family regulator